MPAVILPTPEELLKTLSVKQLPQTRQVPKLYEVAFTNTNITDAHLVIKAIRDDLQGIYAQVIVLNDGSPDIQAQIATINLRLAALEAQALDHESRIAALETP